MATPWLDKILASIETVFRGDPADQETKDAVAEIKSDLAANTASDAELKTALNALVDKLALSTPAPV